MLGIGLNQSQTACQQWINTHGLTHPVLMDPGGAIYGLFGKTFVPWNSVIDGEWILQYTASGYNEPIIINTIEQALAELLWIEHERLRDTEDIVNPYEAISMITSKYSLVPGELMLHWNTDGGSSFTDVVLTSAGDDEYTGAIPAQVLDTTVYYYISAADTGGRTRTDPLDAPTSLHSFYVGVDPTAPVIDHESLGNQVTAQWPSTVSATVTDNGYLDTVTLEFKINGGSTETVSMTLEGDDVYSAALSGFVATGDLIEYRITAVDVAASPNTTVDPASGYHTFTIVDPLPVFIFEPDGTPLSGAAIASELDAMGIYYDMDSVLPENPGLYSTIFTCLGIYSSNHALTGAEGQALADYLDTGGRLYMEGGDTWAFDTETAVHSYFEINGLNDGASDAGPISGAVGTFTEGMSFTYSGGNSYIDKIAPLGGAEAVLLNVTPAYINGVANDGGTYRTVGTSIEFGGLVDDTEPSTKNQLLTKILEYFSMDHLIVVFADGFESGDDTEWSASSP